MNPTGAIMGQSRYRVTPPEEVSGAPVDQNAVTREVKQEQSEMAAIASLVTHSGWMLIEAKMQKRIEAFKSGSYLVDAVASHTTSEKLGEMLKDEMRVAAQLESFIHEVHAAFSAIETEKEQRRAAARRTRGA